MAKRFRILVTGSRKYSDCEAFDRVVRAALGQRELSGVVMASGQQRILIGSLKTGLKIMASGSSDIQLTGIVISWRLEVSVIK